MLSRLLTMASRVLTNLLYTTTLCWDTGISKIFQKIVITDTIDSGGVVANGYYIKFYSNK